MFFKKHTSGTTPTAAEALIDLLIFVVTVGLLCALRYQAAPVISPATFIIPGHETEVKDMPAFFDSVSETMVVTLKIELKTLHPGVFEVQVDDCIERLAVNGVSVMPEKMDRVCSPHDLTRLNLRPYLRPGTNSLSMSISDTGVTEGLTIHVSNTDPLLLAIWIGVFLCIVWYAFRLRLLLPDKSRWPKLLFAVLLFGIVVRLVYVGATPYNVRDYDTDGHIDYIHYVQEEWKIPIAQNGWEFHQPPLYYAFSATWLQLLSPFDLPKSLQYQSIVGWSLVSSIITFVVILFSLTILFPREEYKSTVLAGMMVAVFNGIVFFASRITNEAFSIFLTASTIALLLLWWKRGDRPTLIALSLVFSLAFLTKISVLALAPALAVALLCRPGRTVKTRITEIVMASLIVLLSAGWYPAHRLLVEPDQKKSLTFGNDSMSDTLALSPEQRHFVTFNPLEVVKHPFADPRDDELRRGYLLEYFYRSAFFGEFKFEKLLVLSQLLLILGFFLLPMIFLGAVVDMRRKFFEHLPLHVATAGLLLSAFLYPFIFSFASNQDFRFSAILVLPAAYYAVQGIKALPRWLSYVWHGIVIAFVLATFCFIIALFISA